jgi:XTP/dITP diphosphohydrolase
MINELIFATNNQNKVEEIKAICPESLNIITLKEAGINIDIEEPYDTFEENAKEKCRVIYEMTGKNCFAEDSGLLIDSLNGAPGVYSARYAGTHGDHHANIVKVLQEMEGITNRAAHFKTVISLYQNGTYFLFEGICNGIITNQLFGSNGFGYDPIFIPNGFDLTFAQIDKALKNNISHRKLAFDKLSLFLSNK